MGQKSHSDEPGNMRALELVREAKKASGLSAQEIADRTGIPRSTLANYFSQSAAPRTLTATHLALIAMALGVRPERWITEVARVTAESMRPSGE